MKTVAAVFPAVENAEHVARHLENLGISPSDIHVVAGNDPARKEQYLEEAKREQTGTGEAAISGARLGGGMGVLASVVALAIPGIGPLIAGGAMTTILTGLGVGAAAGGLIGTFKNLGISHDEAGLYEEAVRRGKIFIAVNVNDETQEEKVTRIMDEHGAHDIRHEAETWRSSGWQHPSPSDSSIKWHEETEIVEIPGARARVYPFQKAS